MSGMQRGREDVTIIMVGSSPAPEGPLKPTANAVHRSASRRLDVLPIDDLVVSPLTPCPPRRQACTAWGCWINV